MSNAPDAGLDAAPPGPDAPEIADAGVDAVVIDAPVYRGSTVYGTFGGGGRTGTTSAGGARVNTTFGQTVSGKATRSTGSAETGILPTVKVE